MHEPPRIAPYRLTKLMTTMGASILLFWFANGTLSTQNSSDWSFSRWSSEIWDFKFQQSTLFLLFRLYFMAYKQVKTGWSWLSGSSHLARQVYRKKSIPKLCSLFTLAQTLATNGNAILLWPSHCSIMLFWFHLSTAVGILSSFMFLLLTERMSFMRSLSVLGTIKAISGRINTRWQQMGV